MVWFTIKTNALSSGNDGLDNVVLNSDYNDIPHSLLIH